MRSLPLILAIGCVLAAPAEAQFGLGKKVQNAVARKAGVPTDGGVQTGKVSFDSAVLEMTDARVTQFIKGLEAERAMAARVEAQDDDGIDRRNRAASDAYDKASQEYQRKSDAWDRCHDPIQAKHEKKSDAYVASIDTMAMYRIAERMKAAQARNDMAEVRRLIDSAGKMGSAASAAGQNLGTDYMAEVSKTCGARPTEPPKAKLEDKLDYQDVRDAGLEASGMNDQAYSIMRERIVPFIQSKGKNSGGMMYSKTEAEVLAARLDDLTPYAEHLKSH
jgi:hypothetical protein